MKVVGLTGGIGSGKTTVANFFADLGIPVYIADVEAKKLMNDSPEVKAAVTALFGTEAYIENLLNRKFIAAVVFNDPAKLEALNAIVHPQVAIHFDSWKLRQKAPYVIYEAAILFEKGGYKRCDYSILVTAKHQTRLERLQKRDGATIDEIEARMKNQWPDEKKIPLADFVIENEALPRTKKEVEKIHQMLLDAL